MTEALQAMIQFSFGAQALTPVHRIETLLAPENVGSIRLLEKIGFVQEGLRREIGFWKGHYQDVFLYAFLKKQVIRRPSLNTSSYIGKGERK